MVGGVARVAVLLLGALTVIYFGVYNYLREGAKMRLEEDWVMQGRPGQRDAWVAERLKPVAARIGLWLILPVYVLPLAAIALFVVLTG